MPRPFPVSPVYGKTKGHQLGVLQFLLGFVYHGKAHVGVGGRVPVAGEVLDHRDDPRVHHSVGAAGAGDGDLQGIGVKGPLADDGVIGITPHVQHGGEIHLEAEGLALRP